jgi:CRISPR-associated protein Csm2
MQRNHFVRGAPASGGRGNRAPHSQSGSNDREQRATLDVSAIKFGKEIDRTLYSDVAQKAAEDVSPGRRATKNKPTQLRRFYDELIMMQEKVGSDQFRFDQQVPFIQMLKAKVVYAKGREKVDENFEKLLRHVVDQVRDPDTLKQAKLFMEAFMAFYKVYGPRDS